MSFCTNCGAPRGAGAFCTNCGAPQRPMGAVPAASQPVTPPNVNVPYAPVPAPQGGHGLRNFLIVAFLLLLVVIGLGVAGAIYAVHVAKQKAESLIHQVAPGVIPRKHAPSATPGADSADAATSANAGPASFPPMQSSAARASGASGPAPLKKGMLVVTAVADESGDYESMKSIAGIDDNGVTVTYHADPKKDSASQGSNGQSREVTVNRNVLTQDLQSAHEYAEIFGSNDPPSFPGTTAISASRDVLAELQQKGETSFSFRPDGIKGAIGSLVSMFSGITGGGAKDLNGVSLEKFQKEQCDLKREGNGIYAFPVLLDGQPVNLPALRAACSTDDGLADFYILDQPDYPLMLSWKLGSGSTLQVIKITYPPPSKSNQPAPNVIEQQLKEKKKVDIYGIYFDFASDHLKPESTPVLQEIAGVLKDNPDWKLTVSGHTDNVGGDPYNLDLSRRRAAAVKQALVTQYHVSAVRLATDGFGASRPVDTNDTLAGRARNRRVELTRE